MLSRLASREGPSGLLRWAPQAQLMSCAQVTTTAPNNAAESSKRDLVNFPRIARLDHSPKVRFGVVPDSWFQFFYPKTGVTGPYAFGVTVGTYICSKEILIFEPEWYQGLTMILLIYIVHQKFGQQIFNYFKKKVDEESDQLDAVQRDRKEALRNVIKEAEHSIWQGQGLQTLFDIKKENVMLQQEAAYRDRLLSAYKEVKKRLDYQIEKQNVERRIAQKNLVDWVIRNVLKSITPEQEKNALQKCIADLNGLAAKA